MDTCKSYLINHLEFLKSQFVYSEQTSSWKVFLYDIYTLVCCHKMNKQGFASE